MSGKSVSTMGILTLALASFGLIAGCGAGTVEPPPFLIFVSVAPASVSVQVGQSQQFSATVQNDPTNSGVAWTIGNINCTAALCGTIDASGKYSAPTLMPTTIFPGGVQILASSLANPARTGSGSVSIVPPAPPAPITVTVTPNFVVVGPGLTQQFTATVQNDSANKGVTWSFINAVCTLALCGSIDGTGKYTSPLTGPTLGASIGITATSVTDSTKSGTGYVNLTTPSVYVSIQPQNTALESGQTKQFTTIVQNDPFNKGVVWSVNSSWNSVCSGAECGTVDATGKYTASPTAKPNFTAYITATSLTDPTEGASAYVVVNPIPTGVAVSPANATVALNGTQTFTATSDEFEITPSVSWGVSGAGCSGASCGSIDSSGNYTAPPTAPNPPTVTVTATSALANTVSGLASVNISVNPNNGKLKGQYAFLLSGIDSDSDFQMAGTITADGNGNITGGVADFNFSSSVLLTGPVSGGLNVPLTGTYSVGPDGRGAMTLNHSCQFCNPSQTFSFALNSISGGIAGRGQMTEIDGAWVSSGALALQDPAAFSTNSITGNYAFGMNSPNYLTSPSAGISPFGTCRSVSATGRFTASGGSISAGQADVFVASNDATCTSAPAYAPAVAFGGSYSVNANGRGTAVFSLAGGNATFSKFSFYVVSASELFAIETDDCGPGCTESSEGISGLILQQSAGLFSANSLNGAAVMNFSDDEVYDSLIASLVTFDGSGKLSGISDSVDYDTAAVWTVPVGGTYTVDANGLGRGMLTFSGDLAPRPFYLVSPGKGFVVNSTTGQPGTIESQSMEAFDNTSASGTYVLSLQTPYADGPGSGNSALTYVEGGGTGVVTMDGSGGVQGGTVDAPDGRGGGIGSPFTGTYSIGGNGRGTLTTNSSAGPDLTWIVYIISPSKILLRRTVTLCTQGTIQK